MAEQLKRELNKTYLILSDENGEYEESYELEMITKNGLKTLLPLHVLHVNGRIELYYDVSSRQTLKACTGRSKLTAEMVKNLFEALERLMQEMRAYLLDLESVCLDLEHIYTKEGEFFFCYCPWIKKEVPGAFRGMLEELLGELDYRDTEGVELAYHFYQNACKGNLSIRDILDEHAKVEEAAILREEAWEFTEQEEIPEEFLQETEPPKKEKNRKQGFWKRLFAFFWKKEEPLQEEENREEVPDPFFEEEYSGYDETPEMKAESANTMLLGNLSGSCWRLRPLTQGYEEFCITEDSFLIGKKKEAVDGYIGRDTISRIHSRLFIKQDCLYIMDSNSTNGTFVNGIQVEPGTEVEIFAGDRILFADVGYECYNER